MYKVVSVVASKIEGLPITLIFLIANFAGSRALASLISCSSCLKEGLSKVKQDVIESLISQFSTAEDLSDSSTILVYLIELGRIESAMALISKRERVIDRAEMIESLLENLPEESWSATLLEGLKTVIKGVDNEDSNFYRSDLTRQLVNKLPLSLRSEELIMDVLPWIMKWEYWAKFDAFIVALYEGISREALEDCITALNPPAGWKDRLLRLLPPSLVNKVDSKSTGPPPHKRCTIS